MSFKELINHYSNIGVKAHSLSWEVSLIRKLNLLAFLGTANVLFCLLVFLYFDYLPFVVDCVWVVLCAPLVVICNYRGMYLASTYIFCFIGFGMFASLNLKMGQNSFAFLLYFPLIMSTVQMMGRREMIKHMAIIFLIGFASYCVVLYGLRHQWLLADSDPGMIENLKTINLFFALFTTLLFVTTITYEGTRQEKMISNMLREKEVLLAEVFHRVKNNMNIVTSLLNLKKNASGSVEVQEALEECRNRIFSMALVHQKIYSTKSFTKLDFKDYVSDLINALRVSIDDTHAIIELECEKIDLELANAIPCGLILNELITNSFKHASKPGEQLRVRIRIIQLQNEILLFYSDSGPGLSPEEAKKKNTLGLDIIRSLSEQLDAVFEFGNEKGFTFDLKFPVK
jgi:two-component sensor histidine kinase